MCSAVIAEPFGGAVTEVGSVAVVWALVHAMGLLWSITPGIPRKHAQWGPAKGTSKKLWSSWVQSVGEVLAEQNERRRREPGAPWTTSQWDEVAMGSRKYQRGRRVRQSGVQWALTGVRISPDSQRMEEMDCTFVPTRSAADMGSIMRRRLEDVPGATVTTDCHRSYPAILQQLPHVTHMTVNHSQTLQDPVTSAHTNHVEGVHSILKRETRMQFQRMPSVPPSGQPRYLDLVLWRANSRFRDCSERRKPEFLAEFMCALHARPSGRDGADQRRCARQ